MAKYVRLGSKASIFHDPFTKIKILPGQVVPLENMAKFSKRIDNAVKGGHLENVSESEYKEYLEKQEAIEAAKENTIPGTNKKNKKVKEVVKEEEEEEEDEFDSETFEDYTTEGLMALTRDQLLVLAVYNETELEEKALNKLNKTQLTEEILDLVSEEEEDEDEEE